VRSDFHALLIGVGLYGEATPRLYESLEGSVPDVRRMESFLREKLDFDPGRLSLLTASGVGPEPIEPPAQRPTYENIVAALQHLLESARRGDQVYVHYSGHGGRIPTRFPELKGEGELDEVLVPWNVGDPSARCLLDVELSYWIAELLRRGIVPTLVLDCCHSGGATRTGPVARGGVGVDRSERPVDSLLAPREELAATWRRLASEAVRRAPASGWLPQPQGYVLLAACRATEKAYEVFVEDGGKGGILTHFLHQALERLTPDLTWRQLHARLVAKVHDRYHRQTPVLLGEADRVVFGGRHLPAPPALRVSAVETDGRVLIEAGQAQGLREGAHLAVYSPDGGLLEAGRRVALLRVTQVGSALSWAEVVRQLRPEPIAPGASAEVLEPGAQLQGTVRPVGAKGRLGEALIEHGRGFLRLWSEGEEADFLVAVDALGEYEILDPAEERIPNLRPALRVEDPLAVEILAARLVHLTRFRNVRRLENPDETSNLQGRLGIDLLGIQHGYEPSRRPDPRPFEGTGNRLEMRAGEWTFLRIHNRSSRTLNIALLDLQSHWGVTQVFPGPQDGFCHQLEPQREIVLPLRAELPLGYEQGTEVLKVFAAIGPVNFRWLELPQLDSPLRSGIWPWPADPLEQLLASVAVHVAQKRVWLPSEFPQNEWTTAQVEVVVRN
jgi:hypothetical protein